MGIPDKLLSLNALYQMGNIAYRNFSISLIILL